MYNGCRGDVFVLHEACDVSASPDQLDKAEARGVSKDIAELRLKDIVTDVANEQGVARRVVATNASASSATAPP